MSTTTQPVKHILDGVEIPSTNPDGRGPFYGHKCYLDAVCSLLSRNTPWEPVKVVLREDEILVECLGTGRFCTSDLAYLSNYFQLELGWAIKSWGVGLEPIDYEEPPSVRLLELDIWLDRTKALAGAGNEVPDATKQQLQWGQERIASLRSGRD